MVKRGLGRGLEALLPPDKEQEDADAAVTSIAIDRIMAGRHQPRRQFDNQKLEELAQSIRSHGIIQPIVIKPVGEARYEIIAGERRWRASKMAGLQEIPAIIKDLDSGAVAEVALIENLQREDLNPLEEAEAYRALVEEYGLTQEEIARRVGKSRPVIANALRLLQLPGEVQAMLRDNEITAGHARAILSLKGQEEQLQLARLIQEKQLTVREAEELVQKELSTRQKLVKSGKQNWEWQELEERLQQVFTTRVRIKTGKKGSRIEIYYFSDEDLERILVALLKEDVSRETY